MTTPNEFQILFVDDDELLIRGLRRSIVTIGENCHFEFASSGAEALQWLTLVPFDVIITDLRMPQMDGIQLLERVQKEYPQTVRIVFSGNTKDAPAMRLSELAHQVIPKPCDFEKLVELIQRSIRLKNMLSNTHLMLIINNISRLPSVPTIYTELMNALNNEGADATAVGDIIGQDAAMTAKILQLVNSAFFGLPGKISSPQRAVAYLGVNTVKALVLGTHIFARYENRFGRFFSIDAYWDNTLRVSAYARQIARDLGMGKDEQEEAQVAGIVHNIGKLLFLEYPRYVEKLMAIQIPINTDLEYQLFGVSHAELGAYLLGLWGLPDSIVEAVAMHHRPRAFIYNKPDLVTVLNVAMSLYRMEAARQTDLKPFIDMNYIHSMGLDDHLERWVRLVQI